MAKSETQARKIEPAGPPPEPLRPSKPWLLVTGGLLLAWIGFLVWLAYYSR